VGEPIEVPNDDVRFETQGTSQFLGRPFSPDETAQETDKTLIGKATKERLGFLLRDAFQCGRPPMAR
jgi:hypothetical protein